MRNFNYSNIKNWQWDSEILCLIAAIYKEVGKQEFYLKQRPQELEKLIKIAKIQSTEASNAIEGIVTTNTRIKQLVEEKTMPKNRDKDFEDRFSLVETKMSALDIVRQASLYNVGHFNKQNICELCPSLSDNSIEGALRKLVELKEIKKEGKGKRTCYYRLK